MAVEFITVVWRLSPYRAEKLLVHLAFADWANLDGEFYPTYREIAEKARITRPGAIGIVRSMIDDGEIEMIEQAKTGGRGNRNRYRFAEKYQIAVRELIHKWATKRAERVNQDDSYQRKRVKQDNPLKVNQDDSFSPKRVNEDIEKGKRGREHIRNNRHEPSCNTTVMQQQADGAASQLPAAAAAASDFNKTHLSVFAFSEIEDFVRETKPHIRSVGGFARMIWRSGEEDEAIGRWKESRAGPKENWPKWVFDPKEPGTIEEKKRFHLELCEAQRRAEAEALAFNQQQSAADDAA